MEKSPKKLSAQAAESAPERDRAREESERD